MIAIAPAGLASRLLREAFEGPPGPWSYFTHNEPGTGVLGTLRELTAAQVSTPGGPGHTTIAGHVHHLSSSVGLARQELRGEPSSRDRSLSWTVSTVDETEWTALRARVADEYAKLLLTIRTHGEWDEESLGVVMGAIAHTTYHLGAIRQRVPAS